MSEFLLELQERQVDKHSQLTKIRTSNQVPCVIYGNKKESQAATVGYKPLLKVLVEAGTSNIITLKLAGKNTKVIVREYQQDPVTDKIIHVDFYTVSDKKKFTTIVPLDFIGISKAIKEKGAKLAVKNDKLKVECLPADLPAKIDVDISKLANIGQVISVGELEVSDKVKILNSPNDPVVNVIIPKKIELIEETPKEGEEIVEGEEAKEDVETPKEGEEKPAEGGEKKHARQANPPAGGAGGGDKS